MSLRQVYEIERPLPPIIARMERRGIKIDKDRLIALGDRLDVEMVELDKGILSDVPVTSPQQLGVYLFETLGLPNKGKTELSKQWKTDEGTLLAIGRQVDHPILKAVLRKRELAKQKSTYVIGYLERLDDNNRIHTNLLQTGADTGRFSSYNPNLQNVTASGDFGHELRACFITDAGWLLVVCDHSQIEYRVIAAASMEPYLIEAFKQGKDIHQAVTELLGVDSRRTGKTLNFGVVYGLSVAALAAQLGRTKAETQVLWDLYWSSLPLVRQHIKEVEAAIMYRGYSETMFGRRNYLKVPENKKELAAILRKGFNMETQGTAADIIKMQMPMADNIARRHGAHMLLQVHDELVFEVEEDKAESLRDTIQESGRRIVDIGVPLEMSGGIGINWAEAK